MKVPKRSLPVLLVVMCTLAMGAGVAGATAPSTSAIKHGGTLNIADIGLSFSSLDPQATSGTTTGADYTASFQGLFTYNSSNQIVPELATSWSLSANRLSYTINLRHGVTFQDGTPFNAAAVVYDIERMTSPTVNSQCNPDFTTFSSVVADNNYKVTMNFSAPYAPTVAILAGTVCAMIVSPTAVQSEGANFALHPVGTGPYALVSDIPSQQIIWQKWHGYWDKATAGYYSTIELNSVGSDQTCVDAVESGTAQICVGGTATDAITVKHVKSVHTVVGPAQDVQFLGFQTSAPPFNNIWARRAVIQAIDPSVIDRALYGNYYTVTQNTLTPTNFAWTGNRVHGYPQYSVAQAEQDVAQLPGGKLSFTLNIDNTPAYVNLAEAVQSQLAAAGITATIAPAAGATFFAANRLGQFQGELNQAPDYPDPDTLLYQHVDPGSSNDQQRINIPAVSSLAVEARETISTPQRIKLYNQEQQLLAENAYEVNMWDVPQYYFLAKNVRGFSQLFFEYINYWDIYSA